ncbi:MAG: electron transport complex subunit E [Pseudoflavonifractor capillosus]|uniref:electron transport complex subunit RsxE n=1 Tax=Pseudoflavonifractor capillosus TaxID=106588 RepID=UPI0023F7B715|nr:electron transport complex subunit E [Pseudoflavonifractor capillosus]MCI5929198.1 electron transport complex subunit E [Pseudoflavonifractor capillosus]MDY4660678.1 electron transport complex subunit E [Pseudoflavonifractor capillosus]
MKTKAPSKLSILTNGIIKENPVLVLVLGTCPTLATTTSVSTAIGMGIAAAIVLICSNILISLLRKIIPDSVRIPCYIVVIAGFVSVVQMLVQAYFQDLYDALGVYLPLIVVNCIILGRAEMFASKHSVGESALDGIGMGLGFTLTLVVMATLREVLGAGTFAGIPVPFFSTYNIPILTQTPGGFFIFGCLIALVARITHGKVKHAATGCGNCPNAAVCGKIGKEA